MIAKCVECRKEFDIEEPEAGSIIQCPHCNMKMRILSINVNRIYLETVDEDIEDPEEELEM